MDTESVIAIAREAHAGQRDRLGRDYFDAHLTPIAAGASLFGELAEQAAWLHDVVEDTEMTTERLASLGVDAPVVSAVAAVTRHIGESYDALIRRASMHPTGRLVKLVDTAWNILSNPELAEVDPDSARRLLNERYFPARDRLLAAIGIDKCWLGYVELQRVLETERDSLSRSTST